MNVNTQHCYELSIVMPCLNEAETLSACISKAQGFLAEQDICGEVIVADNGSTDNSQEIARELGARVVNVSEKGYGSALMGGIRAARGRYVIMGDADDSYDFSNLQVFMEKLRDGFELVMGNRFQGGIKPGAMPALHRYLGNPVLSAIGRLFFHIEIGDFHCGLRGFERESILKLDLQTSGMEFASEVVVKASLHGLKMTEVPTILHPDGRSRPPHLRSWHDGWRHLRFLLMYCPRWLFMYPAMLLIFMGFGGMLLLLPNAVSIAGVTFDIHTLLLSSAALIIGGQCLSAAFLVRHFATISGLLPEKTYCFQAWLECISLEIMLGIGSFFILCGLVGIASSLYLWGQAEFGGLIAQNMMRVLVPAVCLLIIGVQIIITGFFKSVLDLKMIETH